ncbi:MAG: folate family ECF transporter S component [Clostridia bacterium]|nr:folate family ECF transporter S component [Clostridia bacterium]
MQTKEVSSKTSKAIHKLTIMSIMVALSIVFGKLIAINFGGAIRFSFENLPILLVSIVLGPFEGAFCGVVADLIGCLLVGYEINPIVTLGAMLVGFMAGLIYRMVYFLPTPVRVLLSILTSHLSGSIIVKTIGLSAFYMTTQNMGFFQLLFIRAAIYIALTIIEGIIIYLLVRNKAISKYINRFKRKPKEKRK